MRHPFATALTTIAALGVAAPVAHGADSGAGAMKIALASPAKGTSAPRFAGATIAAGRPATSTRSTITLPAARVSLGRRSTATLRGSLTLRAGRRAVTLRSLRLTVTSASTGLSGKVGARRITVFASRVGTTPRGGTPTLALRRGALKLTAAGRTLLRQRLKRTVRTGTTLGVASGRLGSAPQNAGAGSPGAPGTTAPSTPAPAPPAPPAGPPAAPPPTHPASPHRDLYLAPCLNETSFAAVDDRSPAPPALPPAAGADPLAWDLRPTFREYVRAGGQIAAWNGAADLGFAGFTFTPAGATYDAGDPGNPADDRAVVRFRGRIDFCFADHVFRIALANPTVVLDGADSSIVVEGDSLQGNFQDPQQAPTLVPPRRVTFATFTAPAPVAGDGGRRTWTVPDTRLTLAGADIANATDSPGNGLWKADLPFGGFTVAVTP